VSRWSVVFLCASLAAFALVLAGCSKGGDDKPKSQQVRAGLSDLSSYKCNLKISGSGGPLTELESAFAVSPAATPAAGPSPTPARAQEVGFEANVTYVKPDKSTVTLKLGNETFSQTTIGKQQWSTLGGITVGPNNVPSQPTASDLSVCSAFWDDGFADAAKSFQCGGGDDGKVEKVNGRDTLRCTIDKATFDQIKAALGGILSDPDSGIRDLSRFSMDIWVTDGGGNAPGGLPVRFTADMAGKDLSNRDFAMKIAMDLSSINDKKVAVSPPK
jgi:hypothetical protein